MAVPTIVVTPRRPALRLVAGAIPAGYASPSDVTDAIADHVAAADPHPGYLTPAGGDARYDASGAASTVATAAATALANHVAAADPHTGYLTEAAAAAGYQPLDSDLTAIAALSTTAFGRALLELANAAAGRSALGAAPATRPQQIVLLQDSINPNLALQRITNQPLAFTTTAAWSRADLSGCTEVRIVATTIGGGIAGSKLGVQYSADSGSTWAHLDGTATGSFGATVLYVDLASATVQASAWATLAAGARADVLLRLCYAGGDGAADPGIAMLEVQAR